MVALPGACCYKISASSGLYGVSKLLAGQQVGPAVWQHIHLPGRRVHLPGQHVHLPGQHVLLPGQHVQLPGQTRP